MTTVSNICDALGRRAIADRVGVGLTTVSNAATSNRFPAKWYVLIKAMCDDAGIECPMDLFSFVAEPPVQSLEREGDPSSEDAA
ncbi:MAG: bacteriophage CI repressor [Rhodobacteraceae bacterium]|nr:bacteriophage CI repressor [Paracoccaceae bacterium]